MTSERKKTILILIGVLILGFLSGFLVHGFVFRQQRSHQQERSGQAQMREHKKDWFVGTIHRIVRPDSAQAKQIKPITTRAAAQIDSVERYSNQQLADILDSVKVQLEPILTPEQLQRLNDFDSRAKGHWRGRRNSR